MSQGPGLEDREAGVTWAVRCVQTTGMWFSGCAGAGLMAGLDLKRSFPS